MTEKSNNVDKARTLFALLAMVFELHVVYEFLHLRRPGLMLISASVALVLAVAPHIDLAFMWSTRNDTLGGAIAKSARVQLVAFRYVLVLILAIVLGLAGFGIELSQVLF